MIARWVVLAVLLSPAVAFADEPLDPIDARIRALEEQIAKLKQQVTDASAQVAAVEPEATGGAEDMGGAGRALEVYGFFDFAFAKIFGIHQENNNITHVLRPYLPETSTFALGNFNLYLDLHSERQWRFLGEVRYTLAPLGAEVSPARVPGTTGTRYDTSVPDSASGEKSIQWSGIVLERVHVEYAPRDSFKVLAGIFLTPYGIWNVDHGSPVVIPARVPFAVEKKLFPERQAGLQLSGNFFPGPVELGYVLTLSNGRGVTSLYSDLDENKAVGGRLVASGSGDLAWRTGLSWYAGSYSTTTRSYESRLGVLRVDEQYLVQSLELSLGFDWQIAYKGLDFRGEFMQRTHRYDDAHRPLSDTACDRTAVNCRLQPDFNDRGMYGLLSYELPIKGLKLRPYTLFEYDPQRDDQKVDDVAVWYLGLNWRITSRAILKGEYVFVRFTQDLKEILKEAGAGAIADGIRRDAQAVRLQLSYAF